jgi:hypothetical protein
MLLEEGKCPLALYATRGERAHFDRLAEAVRSGETSLSQISASSGLAGSTGPPNAWEGLSERIVMRQNHGQGVHALTQLVEIARLPVEQQASAIQELKPSVPSLPVFIRLMYLAQEKVFQAGHRAISLTVIIVTAKSEQNTQKMATLREACQCAPQLRRRYRFWICRARLPG